MMAIQRTKPSLSLPPGLDTLSSHTFGQFTLLVSSEDPSITTCTLLLMGLEEGWSIPVGQKITANLLTTIWHFFVYISDMGSLSFKLGEEGAIAKICLSLKLSQQVLQPQFTGSIFAVQEYDFVVSNRKSKLKVFVDASFDVKLHREISKLMDWHEFIIFQGISPICSSTELPKNQNNNEQLKFLALEPKFQEEVENGEIFMNKKSKIQSAATVKELVQQHEDNDHFQTKFQTKQTEEQNQEKSRVMMEEDIDRLIQQMQQKPYDFSRYQQDHRQMQDYSNNNQKNEMPLRRNATMGNFYPSNEANNEKSTQFANKRQESERMLICKPPRSQSKKKQKSLSVKKISFNKSQMQNTYNSQISKKTDRTAQANLGSNSDLDIKIHELLVSGIDHSGSYENGSAFIVKVFLNNDIEEYYSAQGILEGQNIVFSQKLKIKNASGLTQLRFELKDDYGQTHGTGTFSLNRLFSIEVKKGTFMVSILPQQISEGSRRTIVSSYSHLTPVYFQNGPIHRTLRIEAQITEKVEMVQLFLKISNIKTSFTCIRYRIPFTKQTIEFVPLQSDDHINIFPHSISSPIDKLLLEVWGGQNLLGEVEISLKQLKNINMAIINASNSQPIYLLEGYKEIQDSFNLGKIIGKLHLTLCCGTVRHMQQFLQQVGKQRSLQDRNKVQVDVNERLGILVREKKTMNEISVQVEAVEAEEPEQQFRFNVPIPKNFTDRKNRKSQHEQDVQESMVSHKSANEFLKYSNCKQQLEDEQKEEKQNFEQSHNFLRTKNTIDSGFMSKQISKKQPTLSQIICDFISKSLQPVLPFLELLKQKCKPHLLYNFIQIPKLITFLRQFGFSDSFILNLVGNILCANNEMVNINILYDLCLSLQIDEEVKATLVSDEMLAKQGIRHFYSDQKLWKNKDHIIDSDMDFGQMKAAFNGIGIKLTLNEHSTICNYMKKQGFQGNQGSVKLKQLIIQQLSQQLEKQLRQNFYQEDILQKIYGGVQSGSQMGQSFYSYSNEGFTHEKNSTQLKKVEFLNEHTEKKEKISSANAVKGKDGQRKQQLNQQTNLQEMKPTKSPPSSYLEKQKQQSKIIKISNTTDNRRKYKAIFKVQGIQNVRQSAQCLFDRDVSAAYIRLIIEAPTFEQIIFKNEKIEQTLEVEMELEDADGRMELCLEGKALASAYFSLIKGIKSVYAMKSKQGQFCGLLHLALN